MSPSVPALRRASELLHPVRGEPSGLWPAVNQSMDTSDDLACLLSVLADLRNLDFVHSSLSSLFSARYNVCIVSPTLSVKANFGFAFSRAKNYPGTFIFCVDGEAKFQLEPGIELAQDSERDPLVAKAAPRGSENHHSPPRAWPSDRLRC